MPSTPSLLKKLDALHRQRAEIEYQIVDTERQIVGAAKIDRPRKPRSTKAEVVEVVKATVKVLRDDGGALPRREIAARLGISPWAASYRLNQAIKMKFVEKAGGGRYRATNVVPAF